MPHVAFLPLLICLYQSGGRYQNKFLVNTKLRKISSQRQFSVPEVVVVVVDVVVVVVVVVDVAVVVVVAEIGNSSLLGKHRKP